MTVRDRERSPDVAMVAVVDKSGSMADCHCTGDSRDSANPSGTRGFEKVDIAKEAILRAAEAMAPTDQLGVVAFDQGAHWAVRTAPIDFGTLGNGLGFAADGNTNIFAGLQAAYEDLVDNPATLRHIILITDGWSTHGAYDELLDDMRAAGITLSTIGTGGGSAQLLRELAEESGGRYYDAADATTIPDIFLRETIRTAGEQIVEETFQPIPSAPSEILDGLDAGRLPQLLGYNATTAKGSATVALLTGREDPLLAQWQYGLGRAVAWTSDARQQWATPWIGTPEFGALTAQLVAWTLPPQDSEGIDVRFSPASRASSTWRSPRSTTRPGRATSIGPCCGSSRPTLSRRRPCSTRSARVATRARFAPRTRAPTWCGWRRPSRMRAGPMRPAAPSGSSRRRPRSSGGSGSTPMRWPPTPRQAVGASWPLDDEEAVAAVWRHDIEASAFPTPIWPWLLLLAIALVPLDVGVRRVALRRSDMRRARAWAARRVGLGRAEPEAVPGLADLRAARDRSARRADRVTPPTRGRLRGDNSANGLAPVPVRRLRRSSAPPRRSAAPAPAVDAGRGRGETLAERLARRGAAADQSGSSSSSAASSSARRGAGLVRGTRRTRTSPATATRPPTIGTHGRPR